MEQKKQTDLKNIINFIENHSNRDDFYNLFLKGPDPECGFMWTSTEWWTPQQLNALNIINKKVLDLEWDSSGYGIMMRAIQHKIKSNLKWVVIDDLKDDEGKWKGDPRTGKGSPYYIKDIENPEDFNNQLDNEKNFAKSYLKTSMGKSMDDNNKKAMNIVANQGFNASVNFMMNSAGNDYGRMRSMYG